MKRGIRSGNVTPTTHTYRFSNFSHMVNKLITALRTAVEKGNGSLDKEATSHDDCFDAFRLSLQFWH